MVDADLPADHAGVGLLYNEALAGIIGRSGDRRVVDAVSLIPETCWHESATAPRYRAVPDAFDVFDRITATTPVVLHGIGLSIGSGLPLDVEHLDQVAATIERFGARWYSEHLAAFRVRSGVAGAGTRPITHAGVGLPVPFDVPTLRELCPKVGEAVARVGVPFLLENSAVYVDVPDQDMTEAGFMNRVAAGTGARVLLDLHNLVVNEINLGWDAEAYLAELDLGTVVEIHVAGGEALGAWYTDAHSGACPDRVWELLAAVVPAAPALRLVTFEIHESRVPVLGEAGVLAELARIHDVCALGAARVA